MLPFDIPLLLITEGLISTKCEKQVRLEMCKRQTGKSKSSFFWSISDSVAKRKETQWRRSFLLSQQKEKKNVRKMVVLKREKKIGYVLLMYLVHPVCLQ